MAETWCRAFGRYLRTLRQRRGLSLQEVCSLSQAFAERVDKGYLSRCENGKQGPAFSKIIPLSRIYEVSADVLLERLELDMELDRVGGPDTEGISFAELTSAGSKAMQEGFSWRAYALLRDSIIRATVDPVKKSFRDRREQEACALMNCATGARRLGRRTFALFEYVSVEATQALDQGNQVILLERLSQSYRSLKQIDRAIEYGEKAIRLARRIGESGCIGLAYSNRGQLAFEQLDLESAASFLRKAHEEFRKAGLQFSCARSLNNLAQVYFDQGRLGAAKRALVAARRIADRFDQHRLQILGRILMGEIEMTENKYQLAEKHWKEAAVIAKRLDDKVLRFKAEFFLLMQARQSGNEPAARSLYRRLNKLAHWIPEDTPELAEFRVVSTLPALPSMN